MTVPSLTFLGVRMEKDYKTIDKVPIQSAPLLTVLRV